MKYRLSRLAASLNRIGITPHLRSTRHISWYNEGKSMEGSRISTMESSQRQPISLRSRRTSDATEREGWLASGKKPETFNVPPIFYAYQSQHATRPSSTKSGLSSAPCHQSTSTGNRAPSLRRSALANSDNEGTDAKASMIFRLIVPSWQCQIKSKADSPERKNWLLHHLGQRHWYPYWHPFVSPTNSLFVRSSESDW